MAFLNYPESIRRSLSTTNVVEAVNGQLEIMRRNSGGYFHSEDVLIELITSSLRKSVPSDDALAARMGTSGRQFVSSVYTQERLKREIAALYDELMKSLGLAKQDVSASSRHVGV